ncbi:MAG: hypothetical protein K6U80_13240 [Firmicutes bacterium]|nr:hypothetical protein [Bacillota bacterium]
MKLAMLGHSGVGKTSLIAAMYGTLQSPKQGFTLSAQSKIDHDLLSAFQSLKQGKYPPQSYQREVYYMRLKHNNIKVMSFDIIDYRGGILTEFETSTEQNNVLTDISTADSIILFADSYNILYNKEIAFETNILSDLVASALEKCRYRKAISIVFTKTDLIDNSTFDKVRSPLEKLIGNVFHSDNAIGTIFRTSVGMKMNNVEFPILYCICSMLIDYHNDIVRKRNELVEDANRYNSKISFTDWIDSKLAGTSTYREMRDDKLAEVRKLDKQLADLKNHFTSLRSFLVSHQFPDFNWGK